MFKNKIKGFIMGFITCMIISILATTVFAAMTEKNITVYAGVKVYYDDVILPITDANGNAVEPFIYNGTTYLPVRAISQTFNTPIEWDGKTSSVFIGHHSDPNSVTWIQDLDFFTGNKFLVYASIKDNMGNDRNNCVSAGNARNGQVTSISNVYKINGMYSKITGTLFQRYNCRNSNTSTTVEIIGDGKTLYSALVKGGIEPIDFSVDITGVLELQVKYYTSYSVDGDTAAISNFGLWK